ncbi:uncharacterized protein LOC124555881 [Schistocerca americana]|uniref:uncharacterized protein LOC124555881 n=1 Tax=Schistocerca americana TaxID=7009 RepID=UPI001F4F1854|nr:uncharacterized protein LOC124555881 [Schistocerca americana]
MIDSAADVQPSLREKSVSKEIENLTQSAADDNPSSREKSVPKEIENLTQSVADVHPSSRERSVSVSKEAEDVKYRPNTGDVRQPPSRASVSVTAQTEDIKGGAEDVRPSPSRRSATVEIQKESFTRSVKTYAASYLDRDLRHLSYLDRDIPSRLLKEGSVDVPRYGKSYFEGDFQRRLSKEGSVDVPRYGKSYFEGDFQRRLSKEGSVGLADLHPSAIRGSDNLLNERGKVTPGSADLRPSAIRGSGSLLKERGKVTADLTRHTASNVDRGLQRQLVKEGSADSTLATKYVKDNEKKYLNKYPMEFGGRLGTLLLILFLPLYVLSLFSFNLVPDPTKFEVLFQMQLVLIPQVAVGIIICQWTSD